MNTKLLPCPFCGCADLEMQHVSDMWGETSKVECKGCLASGPQANVHAAAVLWNRRIDDIYEIPQEGPEE